MPSFSKRSNDNVKSCNLNIQIILTEAIKIIDFSVICGLRTNSEQTRLYSKGREYNHELNKWTVIDKSKIVTYVKYPNSRHNKSVLFNKFNMSDAFDISLYPKPDDFWQKVQSLDKIVTDRYVELNNVFQSIAKKNDIKLRWGGDWQGKNRNNFKERKAAGEFIDLPHWEQVI